MSGQRDPLIGHVNHLTPTQSQAFTSFKSLLLSRGLITDPPKHDDGTLLRFLRARRFDPQPAIKQFAEAEAWRSEVGIERFYEDFGVEAWEEAKRVFPLWTGRRDRAGHPFYVYRVKDLDKKVMNRYHHASSHSKNATTDTRHPPPVVALYENLTRLVLPLVSLITDRPDPETPLVSSNNLVDVTGVSLSQFWGLKSHLGDASGLATARYPETLDQIFVVGAPSYIEVIFSFLSQWFDPETRAKIQILPADPTTALRRITEFIPPESIPKSYGGSLDWEFGDQPNLDPELSFGLGLKSDEWPKGPAVMAGSDLVVVGKGRREVVASFKGGMGKVAGLVNGVGVGARAGRKMDGEVGMGFFDHRCGFEQLFTLASVEASVRRTVSSVSAPCELYFGHEPDTGGRLIPFKHMDRKSSIEPMERPPIELHMEPSERDDTSRTPRRTITTTAVSSRPAVIRTDEVAEAAASLPSRPIPIILAPPFPISAGTG